MDEGQVSTAMDASQDEVRMDAPERSEMAAQPGEAIDLGIVDRGVLWTRLALTQTQLAELAGLSQRQVSRWVSHGLLVPSSRDPDRFNGDAVEQAILMQRAIARGHRPTQASRIATLALAKRINDEGGPRVPPSEDAREKLLSAQTAILAALEILFPGGTGREQAQPARTRRAADQPEGERSAEA